MQVECAVCPATFDAKRTNAKYCSDKCRKRAQRSPGGAAVKQPGDGRKTPRHKSQLAAATRSELVKAKRLTSAAGQAALLLAHRIDAGGAESGAALAAMVREHAAAMDRALKASEVDDPVNAISAAYDEVGAKRERRKSAR